MTSLTEFRDRYIKKLATFIATKHRPQWNELTPRDAFLLGVRCAVNDREEFMQSPALSDLYTQWLEEISGGSPTVPEPPVKDVPAASSDDDSDDVPLTSNDDSDDDIRW